MTNNMYKEIETYICEIAAEFVLPIKNVESIRCARFGNNVYMELIHEDGCVRYFDISGRTLSDIGLTISHILSNDPIRLEVQDRLARKEIRKLFK